MSSRRIASIPHAACAVLLVAAVATPSYAQTPSDGGRAPQEQPKPKIKVSGFKFGRGPTPESEARKNKEDAAAVLQAAGKYKTFLALAEQAGVMPLLRGAVKDSNPGHLALKKDAVKISFKGGRPDANNIKVQGQLPPGMSMSDFVDDMMDAMKERLGSELGEETLGESGILTVLAPTDAAFEKFPKGELDALKKDSAALAAFVRHHIVNRGVYSKALPSITGMQTLQGDTIAVTPKTAGKASFVETDLIAKNAVIYGLDTVFPPPAAAADDEH